jgi:hypothetical protein
MLQVADRLITGNVFLILGSPTTRIKALPEWPQRFASAR